MSTYSSLHFLLNQVNPLDWNKVKNPDCQKLLQRYRTKWYQAIHFEAGDKKDIVSHVRAMVDCWDCSLQEKQIFVVGDLFLENICLD